MVQPPRPSATETAAPEGGPTEAQMRFRRALSQTMRRAWVVGALVAANVAVFAAMVATGVDPIDPDARDLVAWGANYGPLTRGPEPLRLGASTFVHGGILHIGFNMYALLAAGRIVERIYGHLGFALLYASAGVAGSAASVATNPMVLSVGASGAVFGVFGALLAFVLRRRALLPAEVIRPLRATIVLVVVVNLAFGFTFPGIDNAAHLGGLVAGTLIGLALAPTFDGDRLVRPWALYPIAPLLAVGAAWAAVA